MMHHVALAFVSFVGTFITWVVLVVGGLAGEPLAVIIPFLIFTPVWVAHLIFFLQWRAAIMTDNSKTVRRFDHDCICSSSFMHKYGDGPYVLYSDYAELAAEKDRLAGLLEAECEALREVAREAHAGLVYTYHAYMKPPSETDGRYEESMFVWNLGPEARDMMPPNEQALFDALMKARAALTTSVQASDSEGGE